MSAPILIFRLAIVLEVILGIGIGVAVYFAPDETNEEILARQTEGFFGFLDGMTEGKEQAEVLPLLIGVGAVFVGLVAALLATYAGLFFFCDWARYANVALFVVGLGAMPFMGWTIIPGWESALNELSSIVAGAVLAMSFLPPAADRFRKGTTFPPSLPPPAPQSP